MNVREEIVRQLLEDAECAMPRGFRSVPDEGSAGGVIRSEAEMGALYTSAIGELLKKRWAPMSTLLPRTIEMIGAKAQEVLMLHEGGVDKGLLYVFVEDEVYSAFFGANGVDLISDFAESLSVDLSTFYACHDGWFEISGLDGLLPCRMFERYIEPVSGADSFLKIAQRGVNSLGFDVETVPTSTYMIWASDEEIERIEDFWNFVDHWYVAALEDFDDRDVSFAWQRLGFS